MNKTINSRTKSKVGELEFIHLLASELGIRMTRNMVQSREVGCDLIPTPDPDSNASVIAFMAKFAVAVKRYSSAKPSDVENWWRQAIKQAGNAEKMPLLAYRTDRAQWLIRVPLASLNNWFPCLETQHFTVSFDVFKSIVETLSTKPL